MGGWGITVQMFTSSLSLPWYHIFLFPPPSSPAPHHHFLTLCPHLLTLTSSSSPPHTHLLTHPPPHPHLIPLISSHTATHAHLLTLISSHTLNSSPSSPLRLLLSEENLLPLTQLLSCSQLLPLLHQCFSVILLLSFSCMRACVCVRVCALRCVGQ